VSESRRLSDSSCQGPIGQKNRSAKVPAISKGEEVLMISKIHQKLGTAGFIISIVALVAALGGGAYAASGGLSGKQKKEVEKIAKKYAGKPGPQGATGAPGAKGDAGAKGDNGAPGANGTNGAPGSNGTNGTNGTTGFTATLPKGATETGNWGFSRTEETLIIAPISFAIPYSVTEDAPVGVYVKNGETGVTECPGTAAKPEAAEGFLCVYEETAIYGGAEVVEPTIESNAVGGRLQVSAGENESRFGFGTWAVTGE
jgi:hypothetical protein